MSMPPSPPARSPSQGEPVAAVTAAAANAPTSILPSSAMLTTPERSLSKPPSAAKTSGVARRAEEKRISSAWSSTFPPQRERPFRRHREDDQRLDHRRQVARDA